jgi:hypothetical protein
VRTHAPPNPGIYHGNSQRANNLCSPAGNGRAIISSCDLILIMWEQQLFCRSHIEEKENL